MAKIVLSSVGSAGDIFPLVGVAAALRARGHSPLMATHAEYRAVVEAAGVAFLPLPPSQEEIEAALGIDTSELVRKTTKATGLEFAVRRIAMPFLKAAYDTMAQACADADLVVTHTSAFAARLAAEKLRLPWLSAVLAPFAFMSEFDPPLLLASPTLEQIRKHAGVGLERAVIHVLKLWAAPWTDTYRRMREELGLPAQPNPLFEGQFSPLGTLALYSKLFGAPQPDFPRRTTITGFSFFDASASARGLDPALGRFLEAGPPPLVFTVGSALIHEPRGFFEAAAGAAYMLGRRAVLLAGADDPQLRKLAGRDIYVASGFVPHSAIFPRADAVIHHGGVGTTAQALRAGRPELVVPYTADQPDNAMRLARMGVSRTLPIGMFTARRAALEIARLSARGYQRRARETAVALAAEDGPDLAAVVIEAQLGARAARRAM